MSDGYHKTETNIYIYMNNSGGDSTPGNPYLWSASDENALLFVTLRSFRGGAYSKWSLWVFAIQSVRTKLCNYSICSIL